MAKLSMYLGRHVCVCLDGWNIERGIFEQCAPNRYYLVRYDGSRNYLKTEKITWIKII
jgi:hypothetical protein